MDSGGPAGWLIAWYAGGARREARPVVIARPSRAHFQQSRPRVYYSEEIDRAHSVVLVIFVGIDSGDHHNGSACTRDPGTVSRSKSLSSVKNALLNLAATGEK